MTNQLKYKIVGGALPVGVTIDENTGKLEGPIDFSNLGLGPVWQSPAAGSLGTFDELDTIELPPLTATLSNGDRANMGLMSDGSYLPWGLVFDPDTGVISGTISELLAGQENDAATRDGPIWQTEFGKLADFDEGQTADITLVAQARNEKTVTVYDVVSGALPWGLVLDSSTGKISGSTADLLAPGLTIEVPKLPAPVWNTPQGTIKIVNEFETVTGLMVAATPASGRTMIKYVISNGALPFGLNMNFTTGEITGTVAELVGQTDPAFYEGDKDPTISDTVSVQGSAQAITNSGSLGSYAKGAIITVQFSATPYPGRTIRNWSIENGSLPFGLTLNQDTGVISGTIENTLRTQSRSYSFTMRFVDNTHAYALRSYTITVQ
jgi:hypothetical protein